MYLMPILKGSVVLRGSLCSIAPTPVAWFVVFPSRGMAPMGLNGGVLMPVMVIVLNIVWGIGSAMWVHEIECNENKEV